MFFSHHLPIALPCQTLLSPVYGNMECIGTHQVVGDICTFTCDKDYVLSGSESRECLPNTTWSGMTTTCSVIQCPELIPSDHSVIVSPCSSDINSTCLLACEPGYYSEGIFVHQQSCKYNSEGIVDWTLPPLCSGNGLLMVHAYENERKGAVLYNNSTLITC